MLDYLTKDDLPEGVIDVVDVIGMDAFKSLVKFAGGSNLYIPNEASLVKGVRNRMIRDRFLGGLGLVQLRLEILLIISDKNPVKNTDGVCCLSITYKPY